MGDWMLDRNAIEAVRVVDGRSPTDFIAQVRVGDGPENITVLNPVAVATVRNIELAPGFDTLNGKRIAFFWNCKPGGDLALQETERLLIEQYPDMIAGQLQWEHHRGGEVIPLSEVLPFEPDAIIISTADCAISVGAAADMVALEKLGIPTVVIVTRHFLSAVQEQARYSGMAQPLRVAVVPEALTNITPVIILGTVADVADDIVAGLSCGRTAEAVVAAANEPSNQVSYHGASAWDVLELFNRNILEHGIGDGLPVIPPTPERVARMLAGFAPDREIAILGLGKGVATIEKIAINAVMAGCEPVHLPVVIAAVRAIAHPNFPLSSVAWSSTAHSTMLIVNGPVARQLGINEGSCCLGPGAVSHANIVIGRAIRLIQMNVAFQYPGVTDFDYLGSGNKFSLCFAENETANPWEPLHVERGFTRDTSTVTAMAVDSQSEGRCASSSPELILRMIAGAVASPTTTGSTQWMKRDRENGPLVVLSATHAKAIADAGWTKGDAKQFLYHHAKVPAFYFKYGGSRRAGQLAEAWKWLADARDETLVPIAARPDAFQIVVVNADGPKSATFTATPGMATVAI